MGFRYPSHWSGLGDMAFAPTVEDHDQHGFSTLFTALLDERDRSLEDYLDSSSRPVVFPWSYDASLVTGTESPRFPVPANMTFDGMTFCLSTPGTTNTVLTANLYNVNGASPVSLFTLTIPSGSLATISVTGQNKGALKGQQVSVTITTAGTGAAGLGGWVGSS